MFCYVRRALAIGTVGLFVTAAPSAYAAAREPKGVYAAVDISDYVTTTGIPPSGDDADMAILYDSLLKNPAISGLALQVHWDFAQPNPPGDQLNWDYIDLAFAMAPMYQGPTGQGKTIQLIPTAGFNSPQWLWDSTQPTGLSSCDPLFTKKRPKYTDCGTATFSYFAEKTDQDQNGVLVLPVPWNTTYTDHWHKFLKALKAKYGSNSTLVSISIAGPTAASAEMILPNNFNTCPTKDAGTCTQPSGLQAEAMWNLMFEFVPPPPQHPPEAPFPTDTDDAFIQSWYAAILFYENHFHDITLVITTGAGTGFPSFNSGYPFSPSNTLYPQECQFSDTGGSTYVSGNYATQSCDSATNIMSFFVSDGVGLHGVRFAGQTSGLSAFNPTTLGASGVSGAGDVGLPGLKYLSMLAATGMLAAPHFLTGAQFDHQFSPSTNDPNAPEKVGCITGANDCPHLRAEQAAYNLLEQFFRGTPAAIAFGGIALEGSGNLPTPAYLQVHYQDVLYAEKPESCAIEIKDYYNSGEKFWMSAQDLLNVAQGALFGQSYSYPPPGQKGHCG